MSTLTRDEILAMGAGPEFDALIATRLFGYTLDYSRTYAGRPTGVPASAGNNAGLLPRYSTDIAAAWEVVEQVRGWELSRRCFFYVMLQGAVRHRLGTNGDVLKNGALLLAIEPEDICKAALLLTLTEEE